MPEDSEKQAIEDQVSEFLKDWPVVGAEEPAKVEEPAKEEPAKEEPGKEVPEKEPAKAKPEGEEPEGEPGEKEPEGEPAFDEEKEALRQEVELLSERLTEPVSTKEEKPPMVAPAIEREEAARILQFVNPETLEAVLRDPDEFNKLIGKVVEVATQQALAATPSIIRKQEDERNELIEATQSFYEKNKDLVKYHRNVSLTAQQVKSLNPNFTVRQVLDESEKLVRERLRLTKTAETIEGKRKAQKGAGLKGGSQKASNIPKKGGMTVADELEMFRNL